MTDKEKIIFQPELDLTKLDQDAAAVERRLLAMYRQVQSLGAQEKKRFTDQLGIIEQLQLREARLQQLRSKANTTQRVTQFNNAIQQTQREMQRLTTVTTAEARKTETAFSKLTSGMSSQIDVLGKTFAAFFAANKLSEFIRRATNEFLEQERVLAKLNTQITIIGKNSKAQADALIAQAEALQAKGFASDDAIESVQVYLAQFGLVPEEIKKAIPVLTDFAAGTSQSIDQAAQAFVMGLNGMGRGLKQYGVNVDTSKNISENFVDILAQLTAIYDGLAAVMSQTTSGSLQQAKIAWGEFAEQLGEIVAPTLNSTGQVLATLLDGSITFAEKMKAITDLSGASMVSLIAQRNAAKMSGEETVKTISEINKEIGILEQANIDLDKRIRAYGAAFVATSPVQEMIKELEANKKKIADLTDSIFSGVVRPAKKDESGKDKAGIRVPVEIAPIDVKGREELKAALRKWVEDATAVIQAEYGRSIPEIELQPKIADQQFSSAFEKMQNTLSGLEKVQLAFMKFFDSMGDEYVKMAQDALQSFSAILAGYQAMLAAQSEAQANRVATAVLIAEKGNAEYLQIELDRQQKQLEQQEKFAKTQQTINTSLVVSNMVVALAKAIAEYGIFSPIAIGQLISTLAVGTAAVVSATAKGFAEGGFTGEGGKYETAGVVHKKEFVFDSDATSKYRDEFEAIHTGKLNLQDAIRKANMYDELQSTIDAGKLSRLVLIKNGSGYDIAMLGKKVDELTEAVRGQERMSVSIDKSGIAIIASKYKSDIDKTNRLAS